MAIRRPPPVARFGPELLEVWRRAAANLPLALKVGVDKQLATKLRHQLYSLRKSLVFYGHPLGTDIQHVTIMILHSPSQGYYLELQAMTKDLQSVLAANGITANEAPALSTIFSDAPPTILETDDDEENPYLKGPK
jgi:hypothetical protein